MKFFAKLTYGNMKQTICGDKDGPLFITIGPFDSHAELLKEISARKNIHLTQIDTYEATQIDSRSP